MLNISSLKAALPDANGFLVQRGQRVVFITATSGKRSKRTKLGTLAYGTIEDIVEHKSWPGQEKPELKFKVRINENCVRSKDCGNQRLWTIPPTYVIAAG